MSRPQALNRLRYWLTARRCVCRGYPRRLAGGSVEVAGVKHRTDGPCYRCDDYGQPAGPEGPW